MKWREWKAKLACLMGSDVDVVRKVEKLDQRQREMGHQLRNIETRLEPLKRLVENMREDEPGRDDLNSIH
jgi:hypothetical protein